MIVSDAPDRSLVRSEVVLGEMPAAAQAAAQPAVLDLVPTPHVSIDDVLSLTRALSTEMSQMQTLLHKLVAISSVSGPPTPCPDRADAAQETQVLSVLVANALMPLQRVSEKIDARLSSIEALLIEHTAVLQRHVTHSADSIASKVADVGASVKTHLQKQHGLFESHHQAMRTQSDRQQQREEQYERRRQQDEHAGRQRQQSRQDHKEEVRIAPNDMSRVASMTAKEVVSHLEKTSRNLETRFDALSKYVEMISSANKTKFTFN